jgi:ribosomal protein S12 methylthiotransferase accessory factor
MIVADIRGHKVVGEVPPSLGGTDTAPAPPELFLASLAQCFGLVATLHCQSRGISSEGLSVTVSADKAKDEDGSEYWTNIALHVHLPEGIDEERAKAILRHAQLACSVRGTLVRQHDIPITLGGKGCCCCE